MKKSWFVVLVAIPLVVVGSIAVWELSGSDARRVGTLQPLEESVPLSWRGAWSEKTEYRTGEVVSLKGVTFVAQRENSATEPDPWCEDDCMWAALTPRATQGPKGDPGPKGEQGAKGDTGGPGLRWMGAWNADADYGAGEVVSHGGSSWLAQPGQGRTTAGYTPPSNLNEWNLVAAKGEQGATGLSAREVVKETISVAPNHQGLKVAFCPAGKESLGGGFSWSSTAASHVLESHPFNDYRGSGWYVNVSNHTQYTYNLHVYVVCAKVN